MMTYRFFRMIEAHASAIAKWNYEGPYSFYNMEDSEETMEDFMNGDYFYALNPENELIGFICKGNSARVLMFMIFSLPWLHLMNGRSRYMNALALKGALFSRVKQGNKMSIFSQ
ncbi:hypothetical protein [Paenibacillus sp. DMB20]|uniref:hypothetical protein n=1 Tax=Paenibacillus sp. DMB20 TaxID=1642570 RepID=UPI000627CF0C|nr:hypothetical protein [Paenibacillus sp. DMB20]KKO52389.1 hypothetical protein XI25_19535 [Paenibacillus sp. DMB20]